MDETDRPDDRRAAGSWVLPNSESRRQGNHEVAKSGIRKRKKTKTYPRLSCKIQHLLTSNHSDKSIASEFFTGDYAAPEGMDDQPPVGEIGLRRKPRSFNILIFNLTG